MANKIPRVPVREQDPKVRVTNFEEVCYGYNVQEAQLQTCIRGCLAVRRSAGTHEEAKSTEEGRERQEPHSFP